MASIRKKGNKWEVQYRVKGFVHPFSERFDSEEEANFRKAQVELEMKRGCFEPPKREIQKYAAMSTKGKTMTVTELLELYIRVHGPEMTPRCLDAVKQRARDCINPFIGSLYIEELTPLTLEAYYRQLSQTKTDEKKGKSHTIGTSTIKKCHGDIRAAINWAIAREVLPLGCNAAAHIKPEAPKEDDVVSWDYDEFCRALTLCQDKQLRFVILMCVVCTMRIGELLGLQWDRVQYADNGGELYIDRQIQRANETELDRSVKTKVLLKFPKQKQTAKSVLYLTPPKKDSSRYVSFGQATVAALEAHKERQDLEKQLMGADYEDYGLVLAQPNGRPYEAGRILKRLTDFCEANGLPCVCTHSLRHTSVDLKLELSGGDIKAVMADAGHRTEAMVTKQYSALRQRRRKGLADEIDVLIRTGEMPAGK